MLADGVLLERLGRATVDEAYQVLDGDAAIKDVTTHEYVDGSIELEFPGARVKQCVYVVVAVDHSHTIVAISKDSTHLIEHRLESGDAHIDEFLVAGLLVRLGEVVVGLFQHLLHVLGE